MGVPDSRPPPGAGPLGTARGLDWGLLRRRVPQAPGRTLAYGLLLINALVAGLGIALLAGAWRVEVRDAEVATLNVARLLARDVDATLDRADLALSAAARALQGPMAAGTLDARALTATLQATTALVPEVTRIVVFDARGRPLCGLPPLSCPSVDLAGRRLLEQLRQHPDAPPSLHGPYVSATTGQRWAVLVRGLHGADGALVGVVMAALPDASLRRVLLGLDLGPQGAVSLLDARLKLLVRAPELSASADPPAGNTVSATLRAAMDANPREGTARALSGIDGVERVVAYRALARVGGYVAVGQASQDVLASWRHLAMGTLALLLTTAGISWALWRTNARAEQRHALAHRLYDEAPCGYHTLDARGRYVRINTTELAWLGCRRDEVLGRQRPSDFLSADGQAVFEAQFAGLQQGGVVADMEVELVGRDGRRRLVLVNARALHDDAGRFSGSNAVTHDITALRQAEQQRLHLAQLQIQNEQLRESSRQRDELVANLSHELRTPLNAMMAFTHHLQSGRVTPDTERLAHHLAQIGASGRQLLQVVETLLVHARLVSGQLPLAREPLDVKAALDDAVALMHEACVARQVTLNCQVEPGLGLVDADPLRLRQVLQGLLDNAVKFSPRGARVELRAMAAGHDDWAIEVEDAGIGIAETDLPLLFTPYLQLSRGSTRTHPGLGLGLDLVRRLVQAHGGSITVQSRLGQGSTFRVQLPRRAR